MIARILYPGYLCFYKPSCWRMSITMIPKESRKNSNAGKERILGSLARKCMKIAPNIKIPIPPAESVEKSEYQIETTSAVAKITFRVPIKYITDEEKPYTSNSSFIDLAPPPLYGVGLLKRKNHTFIMLIKIIALKAIDKYSRIIVCL